MRFWAPGLYLVTLVRGSQLSKSAASLTMVNSGKREAPYNLKKRDGLDTNRNRSLYDDILVFMLQKRSVC